MRQSDRVHVSEAGYSAKSDGKIRHYHVLISTDSKPDLFHHGKPGRIPLKSYYTRFEE